MSRAFSDPLGLFGESDWSILDDGPEDLSFDQVTRSAPGRPSRQIRRVVADASVRGPLRKIQPGALARLAASSGGLGRSPIREPEANKRAAKPAAKPGRPKGGTAPEPKAREKFSGSEGAGRGAQVDAGRKPDDMHAKHSPKARIVTARHCKMRPNNTAGDGSARKFIPWCSR